MLYQLLFRVPAKRCLLAASLEQIDLEGDIRSDGSDFPWDEAEVKKLLAEAINSLAEDRIIIFIDAIDECNFNSSRDIAYFLRELTDCAYVSSVRLDVCFSSRHSPFVSLRDCLEISVEDFNASDIALYVNQKLSLGGLSTQMSDVVVLRDAILAKASGIFLWVVLVVDRLLRDFDEGSNVRYLAAGLNEIPFALGELFTDLLSRNREGRETTIRFFQWAILRSPNLRLREWRHILGFVRCRSLSYLDEWKNSPWYPLEPERARSSTKVKQEASRWFINRCASSFSVRTAFWLWVSFPPAT